MTAETVRAADVVVVGAGPAGMSAAYHLPRRGFVPAGSAAALKVVGGRQPRLPGADHDDVGLARRLRGHGPAPVRSF